MKSQLGVALLAVTSGGAAPHSVNVWEVKVLVNILVNILGVLQMKYFFRKNVFFLNN